MFAGYGFGQAYFGQGPLTPAAIPPPPITFDFPPIRVRNQTSGRALLSVASSRPRTNGFSFGAPHVDDEKESL